MSEPILNESSRLRSIPFSVLLIVLFAGVLSIAGLGERIFWADEVHLINLGRSIIVHGIPVVDDSVKQREVAYEVDDGTGIVYNPTIVYAVKISGHDVYSLHPWLVSYIATVPIAIFGPYAEFWTRLPFVLIGLLGIPITFALGRRLVNERTGIFASVLMGFSVVFLLALRNVNYYGLVFFAVPLTVLGYVRLLNNEKFAHIHFTLAAAIVFHSQWLTFLGMMAGVYAHLLLFERTKLRRFVLPTIGVVLLTLPWFIITGQFSKASVINGLTGYLLFGVIGLYQIVIWLSPLVILIFVPFLLKKHRGLWILLLVIISTLAITSLNSYTGTPIRYFYGVLPFCSILSAAVINSLANKSRIIAGAVICLLIMTNIVSVLPLLPVKPVALNLSNMGVRDTILQERVDFVDKTLQPRILIAEYLREITVPVKSITTGILNVLKEKNSQVEVCVSGSAEGINEELAGSVFVGAGDPAALAYYSGLNVSTYANNYKTRTFDWVVLTADDSRNLDFENVAMENKTYIDLSTERWGDTADPTHHLFTTTKGTGAVVYHLRATKELG